MEESFYDQLFNDIPNFAFGENQVNKRFKSPSDMVPIIREAMKKIYTIPEIAEARKYYFEDEDIEDKYIKRGEFGELVLYHLLHKYFGAKALISKIYFKDSLNSAAHGFDAVHVDTEGKSLWIGESKLYQNGSKAITELVKDLTSHFRTDFFNSEFTIISNRVQDDNGEVDDFIKKLIDPNTRCLDKLANIKIALFAGFTSDCIINQCGKAQMPDQVFLDDLKREAQKLINKLNKGKENHAWNSELDVYLFLFPLKDKKEFVKSLHLKLKGVQLI
ncbi:DUF1837 domain-containing protein [Listeria booriae]|nr:DUF1837 domain-containing protein [Listeria booriae]MBC2365190.1 DUF1837 domain-containing protein [Listeria booriae]